MSFTTQTRLQLSVATVSVKLQGTADQVLGMERETHYPETFLFPGHCLMPMPAGGLKRPDGTSGLTASLKQPLAIRYPSPLSTSQVIRQRTLTESPESVNLEQSNSPWLRVISAVTDN